MSRAAFIGCGIASPLLAHVVLTVGRPASAALALILLQMALAWWFVLKRAGPLLRTPAVILLTVISVALCFLRATEGLILSSGITHAFVYLGLLTIFGASLLPDHEPIVTFLARKIHGPPSASVRRYTRRVTLAWCVFFCLQLIGSATLLAFAPTAWWSAFVNVLNAPLIFAMFLGERLARPLWLADAPRERFADVLGIFGTVKGRLARQDTGVP